MKTQQLLTFAALDLDLLDGLHRAVRLAHRITPEFETLEEYLRKARELQELTDDEAVREEVSAARYAAAQA